MVQWKTLQRNRRVRGGAVAVFVLACLYSLCQSVYGVSNSNSSFYQRVLRQSQGKHETQTSVEVFREDTSRLNRLPENASLRQQLHFQFPYQPEEPIPKYIWQTWKYPRDSEDFSQSFHKHTEKWIATNPEYTYTLIPDSVARELVRHLYQTVPQVVQAYDILPKPILKADFFRYLILFARGGIYSDVDTVPVKPAETWVSNNRTLYDGPNTAGLVVGIEADPDRPDWHDYYAKRVQFCQWTIQAKTGHPMLGELIAKITEITLQKHKDGTLNKVVGKDAGGDIMDWTGPGIFTDQVFEYMNEVVKHDASARVVNKTPKNEYNTGLNYLKDGIDWHFFTLMTEPVVVDDVLVLPITGFSPGVGHMGSKSPDHPDAYVRHMFEGSWKPENENRANVKQQKPQKKKSPH